MEKLEGKEDEIRNENEELIHIFESELATSGLSAKTIKRHLDNVDFYLNEYILYEDEGNMEDGIWQLDEFLGYYFIHKCAWSTPASIKSTAASIKKFYKCMLEHEKIEKADYEYLCSDIKENMPLWQDSCARFNGDEDYWYGI